MAGASSYLPDRYQGIDRESYAYKMLASMGWQEGDGLVRRRSTGKSCAFASERFVSGTL